MQAPLHEDAEAKFRELREALVVLVSQMAPQELKELGDLPKEVVVLLAPAMVARVGAEMARGAADDLAQEVSHRLQASLSNLPQDSLRAVRDRVLEDLLSQSTSLPATHALQFVQRLAPFITEIDWNSRGAWVLWRSISGCESEGLSSSLGALFLRVLDSDELTTAFCKWCAKQSLLSKIGRAHV